MFHEVAPANAGKQTQQFCLASWNIGGGSEQMVLDLLANIRGRPEFENLQILCLQEVDTRPGLHFAEDNMWWLLHGTEEGEWRGEGIRNLQDTG